MEPSLPALPFQALATGALPPLGAYGGLPSQVDLRGTEPRLARRLLSHKRWYYTLLTGPDLLCAAAIIDLGYICKGFAFLCTPAGVQVQRSTLGAPRLSAHVGGALQRGAEAWFRGPGLQLRFSCPGTDDDYQLHVRGAEVEVNASLRGAGAPQPLSALCRPPGGGLNFTAKRALMPVTGRCQLRDRSLTLDGALGGFDYTQGFPPRHTTWRWAFLQGQTRAGLPVALNLVEGFNGAAECVLWVDGRPWPLDEGVIGHEADLSRPWTVRSRCGAVDLRFAPWGLHQERDNLLLVRARFAQVAGAFSGTVRAGGQEHALDRCLGVVEDQDMLW